MPNSLLSSVLPVLRNLPSDHPRTPLLPGLKRRPASLWPMVFVVALSTLVAIVVWQLVNENEETTPSRSVATGRIIQVEPVDMPNGVGQNFVKYRFMAGHKILTGNEIVEHRSVMPALGDEIRVSYNPAAPKDNYRAPSDAEIRSQEQTQKILFALLPVGAFLWLFFMSFAFLPIAPRDWINWRCARDLYRNGEITAGRVQFVRLESVLRSPNTASGYEIVATYKVEGVRLLATTRCNNAWLVNQLAPEVEVVVAYDPLKPERAVILEPFAF